MFFSGSRAGFLIKTNLETTIPSRVEEIRFKGCKLSLTVFFFRTIYPIVEECGLLYIKRELLSEVCSLCLCSPLAEY